MTIYFADYAVQYAHNNYQKCTTLASISWLFDITFFFAMLHEDLFVREHPLSARSSNVAGYVNERDDLYMHS